MPDASHLVAKIYFHQCRESWALPPGEALMESKEKYRILLENSLQGLSIIQDDHFVFCNSAFAAMSGYSVEELLSFPDSKALLHPDDRELVHERYQNRLAGNPVPPRHEHRIRRKDGTDRWVETFASRIDYNGRPAVQVVDMDITDSKVAMDQLRQLANEQKTILSTIIMGICYLINRKVQWINPALLSMFGYEAHELLGKDTSIFYSDQEDYRRLAREGYPQLAKGKVYFTEVCMKKKDGSLFWCGLTGQAVAQSLDGGSIWVFNDITEHRRIEEALRASEERFKRLVHNSNDIITVLDEKGMQISVNGPVEKVLGYRAEELIGTNAFNLIHPDDTESATQIFGKALMQPGISLRIEFRYRHKNGTWVDLEAVGTNLLHDLIVQGVVLNSRNNTERKKLEAQLQQASKMEALGALAGGVAHDFNNLLNVINGYCELLLDDLGTEDPMRNDLDQIRKAGQRATSLTSQLLAFGRKQLLQPEILDLNDDIAQMSSMLRRMIREDIDLITIAQPDLNRIKADPGQIQQIVMNLAINARDAMCAGGKLVIETANIDFDEDYIQKHPEVRAGSYVMLAISDNGIGMDAATQSRIFEPFFTTKEKGKGTGLGLATVYGIVKQSNGFIWVYSEPGEGTTFKIYFPRAEDNTARLTLESKSVEGARGVETVLISEDERSVRALAAQILRKRGYNVLEASSGKEALDIAKKYAGEIHLVVTDVVMPGISGTELVSRLKTIRPGIKVLYVSGYTDNAIVHHGILDAGVAFLQKPFSVDGLASKVREVIDS